ncbi:MAG: methionyl-tRNA formyltransferase [Bacteroidetes bacterium]|nr:methionyl-tRNA formyltransferase [Bacteroidota bacterium]
MEEKAKQIPLIFFGTPAFAAIQLDHLLSHGYNVRAAVTAPDKPAGRGLKLRQSETKQVALRYQIPVLQPVSLRDPGFQNELKAFGADLFVVIAFRMLPVEVWAMPPMGTFNLHASLLPDYRGAAPINWAIINGETQTGLTTFFLNENIDEGHIILQAPMDILPDETAGELHDRMCTEAWPLLQNTLQMIASGKVSPTPQDHGKALHKAPKLHREHQRIQWHQPLFQIRNLIRGLSPKPGAFTEIQHQSGKSDELRILRANTGPKLTDADAYRLFVFNKQLIVSHTDGWLYLDEVQLKGKNSLKASEFVKGFRDDGGWKVL